MGGFAPGAIAEPTLVTTHRDPASLVGARVIADVADEIHFVEPKASPLCAVLGGIKKKRKAHQYRVDWIEKDPLPRRLTVTGAHTSAVTTVNVIAGDGTKVGINYVLQNTRTKEQIVLTATPGADALAVVRGIGGGAATMDDGDTLIFTRAVYPDGSGLGAMKSTVERAEYNLCEIVRTPAGQTGREMHTDLYGGSDLLSERQAQAVEHNKSMEYAVLLGKRHSRTHANGHLQTMMNGLENVIETNVWDLGGVVTPTYDAFTLWLEYVMQYGKSGKRFGRGVKYLFASDHWLTVIQGWMTNQLEYRPLDKQIGVEAATIKTTHGTVKVVPEPILSEFNSDMAFLLDLSEMRYVYLQGRDTKLLKNRQGNDEDLYEEELFTDFSIEISNQRAHGIARGLPSAA